MAAIDLKFEGGGSETALGEVKTFIGREPLFVEDSKTYLQNGYATDSYDPSLNRTPIFELMDLAGLPLEITQINDIAYDSSAGLLALATIAGTYVYDITADVWRRSADASFRVAISDNGNIHYMYAESSNAYVKSSSDRGVTWNFKLTIASTYITSREDGEILTHLNKVFVIGDKLFKMSDDYGASYTTSVTLPKSNMNTLNYAPSTNTIICGGDTDFVISNNGGTSFTAITYKPSYKVSNIATDNSGTWVACGANGMIYVSEDNGVNWYKSNIISTASLLNMMYLPDGMWMASSGGTLLSTYDIKGNWVKSYFRDSGVSCITKDNASSNIYAAGNNRNILEDVGLFGFSLNDSDFNAYKYMRVL